MPSQSKDNLPLPNALSAVEAAVRLESLTAAAAELHIAQSAVSRHVSNVEGRTGLQLFKRSGNRLVATPEGEALARAIRDGLGMIRGRIAELKAKQRNTFLLGCSTEIAQGFVIPRFELIMSHVPDGQVRLLTALDYGDFDHPDVDLSIRFGRAGQWPGYDVFPLMGGEWFPVCAPALRERCPALGGDEPDLAGAPLLHLGFDPEDVGSWNMWLDVEGDIPGPRFNGYLSLIHAAIAGHGVALAWRGFVEDNLERQELVRLGNRSMTSVERWHVVVRPERSAMLDRIVRSLVESVTF